MRTQLIETGRTAGNWNGGMTTVLRGVEHVSRFLSKMGQETRPVRLMASEKKAGDKAWPSFFSRPTWIRTGVFTMSSLWGGEASGRGFLSAKTNWTRQGLERVFGTGPRTRGTVREGTWLTTGVFELACLAKGGFTAGTTAAYNAFFSRPTWIRTGVFRLGTRGYGLAVASLLKPFTRTWITTGVFSLSNTWGRAGDHSAESMRLAA
mgnify:CR=1 FL=1